MELGRGIDDSVSLAFCTFGMFIIDEIEYTDKQATRAKSSKNLIGGAGTYAAVGARLVAGLPHSQKVSWIVDVGSDFPPAFKSTIESWNTTCVFRTDDSRLTTRAWNGYGPNEHRAFKYLTPKIRIDPSSLSEAQVQSQSFHMVCSPRRCMDIVQGLKARRPPTAFDPNRPPHLAKTSDPILVWEPIPDLCTPAELQNLQLAAREVVVVSPNAEELAAFFGKETEGGVVPTSLTPAQQVQEFMGWNTTDATWRTHVIVREGAQGCTIYFAPAIFARHQNNNDSRRTSTSLHLPAYHTAEMASQVIDPTGGGNTFLGGLAMAMTEPILADSRWITAEIYRSLFSFVPPATWGQVQRKSVITATLYAVIAASFAIEQQGVPTLTSTGLSDDDDENVMDEDKFYQLTEEQTENSDEEIDDFVDPNGPHTMSEVDSEEERENADEHWNDTDFGVRMMEYLKREGPQIRSQMLCLLPLT